MKKLVCTLGVIFGLLLLNSCGMKECKCVSTNKIVQNDSIIRTDRVDTVNNNTLLNIIINLNFIVNRVDTVYNNTRGKCEDFNINQVLTMDTGVVVYHTMTCMDN